MCIYMPPPAGIDIPKGCCLKILKSLYGLRQASRNWHNVLKESIRLMEYQQCALDQYFFVQRVRVVS